MNSEISRGADMAAAVSEVTPEEDYITVIDVLQVVVENLRLLILGPLMVGGIALGFSFLMTPLFTATTKIMPPQQQSSGAAAMLQGLGALSGLAGAATGLKNPADQYVAFVKSRSVQDALILRFKLTGHYGLKAREDTRNTLGGNVQVTSGKDGLITIEASDTDPALAAQLANGHVDELKKLLSRLAVTEAQQRRMFFEKQLATAKENLIKAEQALKASGIDRSVMKSNPQLAVEELAILKAHITAQEIKLASMRGYLTESNGEFRQALNELSAMRTQLLNAEKNQPSDEASTSDYIPKFRNFKYQETLFELFAKQYEIARMDESREGSIVQVIDTAEVPERKSKPKRAVIAMIAALVALVALLIFIFIRKSVRNAARSPISASKVMALRQAFATSMGRRPD